MTWVLVAPEKFAVTKGAPAPVKIGSPVAAPKVMLGMASVPAIRWNELIWVKVPPKDNWCEP